jgi:signal transduction histidine kinase/HAMP domain-containing protein
MNIAPRPRDLPLRAQLMAAFAFLSIVTSAISIITLTALHAQGMNAALGERAQRYQRHVQRQFGSLRSLDNEAVRSLLALYAGDSEIEGMGIYADNGSRIGALGTAPDRFPTPVGHSVPRRDQLTVIRTLTARDGRTARLYLSLSTRPNDAILRREIWIASGVGTGIALCALMLAARTSRRIASRFVSISDAANRVAAGDTTHTLLDDSAKDEIGGLARSFNIMVGELNRLSGEYDRLVSTERAQLESIVSERTKALEQSKEMFRLMAESTKAIPFTLDLTECCFTYIGTRAIAESGVPETKWKEPGSLDTIIPRGVNPEVRQRLDECQTGPFEFVSSLMRRGNRRAEMRWTGTCEIIANTKVLRGLLLDITELRRQGRERAEAQKLESVGRLAAGVAHEINTPVQFVSDNVNFVRTSMTDIAMVIDVYRELREAVKSGAGVAAAAHRVAAAEQAADLTYVLQNVPLAVDSAIDGLERIAIIVRSMKEFAHPDQAQKCFADINQAIRSTLVIAHNEYKYVADIDTNFADLPLVQCYLGEINQVVLNLLVNASHAIADSVRDTAVRGKLTVMTRLDGDVVEISIADTGAGIPEAIRDRIFDPFFTTKEVGKGTGQGLALAHSVIVIKHGGALRFETEPGKGTTFYIRLPVSASDIIAGAAVAA